MKMLIASGLLLMSSSMALGNELTTECRIGLRDYLAGMSISGANPGEGDGVPDEFMYKYARDAYAIADVMLEVRRESIPPIE